MSEVAPITIALTDLRPHWLPAHGQLLCLARYLAQEGVFSPCVCAPEDSALLHAARAVELPCLPLGGSTAGNLRSLWRLRWGFAGAKPLIFHSFCPESLRQGRYLAAVRSAQHTAQVHSALWCTDIDAGANLCATSAQSAKPTAHQKNATSPKAAPRESTDDTAVKAAPSPDVHPPLRLPAAWRHVQRVVCGSSLVSTLLMDAGLPRETMDIILPAVDMAALPPKQERGDGRFVFVVMEPLEKGRGLHVLIRAMAALWQRQDLTPWEVRVVGEGPEFDTLLEEAKGLGVAGRLSLLGTQDAALVLPQADVILATSQQTQGSWPAPAMAWGMGIPLLYNAVPGNNELASGRECGLMLPMNDPQFLAQHMIRCMTDATLRERLTAQGATMRQRMDYPRPGQEYSQVYRRLASAAGWAVPRAAQAPSEPVTAPPHPHTQDTA